MSRDIPVNDLTYTAQAPERSPRRTQRWGLVERVPAGAGAAGVGVVDREALLLDRVHEVDGRAGEVRHAHPVDDDAHGAVGVLLNAVTVERALVEEQLVAQAR